MEAGIGERVAAGLAEAQSKLNSQLDEFKAEAAAAADAQKESASEFITAECAKLRSEIDAKVRTVMLSSLVSPVSHCVL